MKSIGVLLSLLLVGCGASQSTPGPARSQAPTRARLFVVDSRAALSGFSETPLPGQAPEIFRFDLNRGLGTMSQTVEKVPGRRMIPVMLAADSLTDTGYLSETDPTGFGQVLVLQEFSRPHQTNQESVINGFRHPRGIVFSSAAQGTLYVAEADEAAGLWVLSGLRSRIPDSTRASDFYSLDALGLPTRTRPTQLAFSSQHQLLFMGLTGEFSGVAVLSVAPSGPRSVAVVALDSGSEVSGVAYDDVNDRLFVAQPGPNTPGALSPGRIRVFNQASQLSPGSRPAYSIDGISAPGYMAFDPSSGRLAVGTDVIEYVQSGTTVEHGEILIFSPGSESPGPQEVITLSSVTNPTSIPDIHFGPYFDDPVNQFLRI